ncbi:hypothetical protein PI124_g19103 [Phytophthora idaei]|nr:hypothetical protein PI125_g21284 [Phytophthora idaei]KAG3134896.1 hypothetical protein PI126_g18498 [Phytophthora idaei]KAG3235880.1 hypothetical protein PI124_g19103 [Phytophthora idaei]
MEGLRVGPARTQLFQVQASTLEEAIQVALREEHSHRQHLRGQGALRRVRIAQPPVDLSPWNSESRARAPPTRPLEDYCHIFDGVTGRPVKAAGIHLEPLPEVSELLNLEEMVVDDFLANLKAGEIAVVVLLKPETTPEELNSSSVLDEDVLKEMKKRRKARLGSEVLKNPKDPVYPLVKEFADVVSKDPPSQLDASQRHSAGWQVACSAKTSQ